MRTATRTAPRPAIRPPGRPGRARVEGMTGIVAAPERARVSDGGGLRVTPCRRGGWYHPVGASSDAATSSALSCSALSCSARPRPAVPGAPAAAAAPAGAPVPVAAAVPVAAPCLLPQPCPSPPPLRPLLHRRRPPCRPVGAIASPVLVARHLPGWRHRLRRRRSAVAASSSPTVAMHRQPGRRGERPGRRIGGDDRQDAGCARAPRGRAAGS